VNPPALVDTHAHLMDRAYDADRQDVFERAREAGVLRMVLVGYDLESSRVAVELARSLPGTGAAVGIHPNSAAEASDADFDTLAMLARSPEVVAIGETGLDNYRDFTPPARQREAFELHLRLAAELDLPVIVHDRDADDGVAETANTPGVLHCFSSTNVEYLEQMLALGYYISFAGTLTFNTAGQLRAMAERAPLDRLLVETDCPYLAPVPHRGRRNEPAYVRDTARCLADTLGLDFDHLAAQLWSNSAAAFPMLAARTSGHEASMGDLHANSLSRDVSPNVPRQRREGSKGNLPLSSSSRDKRRAGEADP
jgi:TatD DNase family protein